MIFYFITSQKYFSTFVRVLLKGQKYKNNIIASYLHIWMKSSLNGVYSNENPQFCVSIPKTLGYITGSLRPSCVWHPRIAVEAVYMFYYYHMNIYLQESI